MPCLQEVDVGALDAKTHLSEYLERARRVNSVVLDSSAAIALVLPDELSPQVHAFFDSIDPGTTTILVPALWWHECTNVLLTAVRRDRLAAADAREAMSLLRRLPTHTQDASSPVDALHMFHLGLESRALVYRALRRYE